MVHYLVWQGEDRGGKKKHIEGLGEWLKTEGSGRKIPRKWRRKE